MSRQECKQIIDNGAEVQGAAACLGASVALFGAGGVEMSPEAAERIKEQGRSYIDAVNAGLAELQSPPLEAA